MTPRDRLDHALKRLATAVETLELVQGRRAQSQAARANLEEEYAIMQDDRARLAVELDAMIAHNKTLLAANGDVARRLERVGASIRDALATADPPA